jgi:hypothetical protein
MSHTMNDNRMKNGNHKAEKSPEETDEPQAGAARTEPAEPESLAHKQLDEIPANEGGKGSLP